VIEAHQGDGDVPRSSASPVPVLAIAEVQVTQRLPYVTVQPQGGTVIVRFCIEAGSVEVQYRPYSGTDGAWTYRDPIGQVLGIQKDEQRRVIKAGAIGLFRDVPRQENPCEVCVTAYHVVDTMLFAAPVDDFAHGLKVTD
jgi:hypothetical protein